MSVSCTSAFFAKLGQATVKAQGVGLDGHKVHTGENTKEKCIDAEGELHILKCMQL